MKLALLNPLRAVMSVRHILLLFLFTLLSIISEAQCPPTVTAISLSGSQIVTPTSASICSGDSIKMVCSPLTGTTWQWFKNGFPIPGATQSTYYGMDAAQYTVKTGSCGSLSSAMNVIIKPLPVLWITPTATALCNGQQVTLFVTAGSNVGWAWIAPNPSAIYLTQTNPVTPNITTTTTFQVVGGDQLTGCAKTDAVTVVVYPILTSGTVQSNAQICPGETPPPITATPSTGSNGIYHYQWQSSTTSATTGFTDIPGATSLTYQPGPTAQTTWYRLVTTSAPCDPVTSNAVIVQVNPIPVISNATRTICSGNNVNYHPTSSIGGTTYTWTASVISGPVSGVSASGTGTINNVLSLPAGWVTPGQVKYVITPYGPAPSSCPGTPKDLVVTVNPIPLVTNNPLTQDICAGTFTTPVILQSNLANTTFTWSAIATPGISGYLASGSGNLLARQIFSSLLVAGTITYTITPHNPNGCDGPSVQYIVNVNPSPSVTNNPMQQTICTGDKTTAVTLTSNVPSTTFVWTASAVPASVSGYQASGTSTLPIQTIKNPSNVPGIVTYHIIPSGSLNGCAGVPSDYVVTVNPKPVASATPAVLTICSGETTNIALSSTVAGTTFTWTAKTPSAISGYSDGSGSTIEQTLSNISNAPHDVTYTVIPSVNGCDGDPIKVVVTVNPAMDLTVVPAAPVTCSGSPIDITLVGNISGIAFTWTATPVGNVTGYSDGFGSTVSQTLVNHDNVPRTVIYSVMMSYLGCVDGPTNFSVVVYPEPKITNNPLTATRCSGTAFNLALTSNVSATTYTWTANGSPGISGFAGGIGGIINQTLVNGTNAPGTVVYTITPSANGCPGTPADYVVTVNPIPNVNLDLATQSICSGTSTTQVNFSSAVAGTTYTWTASPSGPGITGYAASGINFIQSQVINSSLTVQGSVTYSVKPSFEGCTGPAANHVVTVNPRPMVINSPMSQLICSGGTSANVNLLSNVASTSFTWIATPSSAAITGFQSSGGNTIPAQTIFNSSTTQGSVTYQIIPTSNFGPDCQGTIANYTIFVNPLPSITSSLSEVLCSGQSFNYAISANIPGTTFTWTRAAVSGISNPTASGTSSSINEILVNTTNSDINVQYILTPFGQAPTSCPGNPESLFVKVRALPQVNAGLDLTIPYGTYTTLDGSAIGGTGVLSYSWTPNSYIGFGASTQTPQTINLTITRSYTLSVTDGVGCSSTDQMTVFVVGSPLAVAPTATPSTICVGGTSVLNANASGGSGTYSYTWTSVPAGFTSNAENPSVSPLVSTTYTVTVNDGFNSATGSVTVTVNPLPLKYVLTGGGSYCIGGSGVVVGLAGSQSGVTYQLYNNGNPVGSPLLGNGAPMSFGNQTAAGSYTVMATRISTGCAQDMGSSVSVSINPLPIADAGLDQIIPYGTNTTLFGTASAGFGVMNYSWEPSSFFASGANTFSPLTKNVYSNITFTLNVTDANGCTGSDQVSVSLSGSAINIIAISGPDEICADSSQAQLTAIVTGGAGVYSYSWTSNPKDNSVWDSTAQNPVVSPDVTTTYTVTVSDSYNSAVASANILVDPLPLEYSVTGGGPYCFAGAGASIGLSGSEPNTNYQLYRGGVPDGPPVTGNGSPISFGNRTASFAYTVLATKNISGCTKLMNGSTTITIVAPPASYLVTGGGSYPFGGPGRQIGLSNGDNGVSYQLYYNNTPIGTPVPGTGSSINFGYQTQAGTYTVVGTDIVTGCTADMQGSVDIIILPLPKTFHVIGGGVICQGEPGLPVGLTGSETGIDYQLLLNGFPHGALVAGTNMPLTWGPFSISGLFEVRAVNSSTGATQMMNDSAVIIVNPALAIFSMDPQGSQCPGTIIRLNGSESGIMYYMMLNGVVIDTIAGTGAIGFLDFGPQTINGLYTINAVNPTTGCQAIMNGSTYINEAPQVFNVTPTGILCPGQPISLSGSETGVNYQLRWNGTFDLGAPVAGTGSAIVVGTAGLPGIYSIIAIDATTNCVSYMNDSATLYSDPTAFTMVPDGPACEGEIIGLNGSEIGVDYVLLLDNAIHVDTVSGTGLPISFGPQLTAGNYTVIATNQTSYCQFTMNGLTTMNDSPIKYSLQPAGIQCIGTTISLSGSQTGVSYQLILDGMFSMGAPVAGNGGVISFGSQSLSGTYTVIAVNDVTGCNSVMSDSTILEPLPVAFVTTPAGSYCAGGSIGLNGSALNTNYILVLNGTILIDTLSGTGNALDFGPQVMAGIYSVLAYNTNTYCSNAMDGISIIKSAPAVFNITPAGIVCSGSTIGLDNSEPGVIYQLRRDGITIVGAPITGTGSAISFGVITIPGTYTVIATNTLNGCANTMNGNVVLEPLPLVYSIAPQGMYCAGESISLNGSQTGIDYILIRDNGFPTDTIPGNGSVIDFGPQFATGIYTIEAINATTHCNANMNGSIQIMALPVAFNITPAGLSCESAVAGLDGSESDVSYTLYKNGISTGVTVNGTGNAISFGLQDFGDYTVKAVNQSTHCSIIMPGLLKISRPAEINSGSDINICSTQPVTLNATINYSGAAIWSTTGDGLFDDPALLTATYTPGVIDIATGKVNLLLSAFGTGTCITTQVVDTLAVTIDPLATANAGGDIDVCSADDLTVKGASAVNAHSVTWISSGSGSFINVNQIEPTYLPTAADRIAGSVTLTLLVTGNSPCGNNASDIMTMTFHPVATVNAGPDAEIMAGSNFTITAASATNNNGVLWSTAGTGTFTDGNTLTATYNPSIADYAAGSVVLSLTAFSNPPCSPVVDSMILSFSENPAVEFTWGATCEAQPTTFTVDSTVTHIGAVATWLWDFGDGNTSTLMNPVHTYATSGEFSVTLTAKDLTGVSKTVSHTVTSIQLPFSLFKSSIPNCSNALVNFTDMAHTLYGYIAEWVWNYGDGSANDTIHFPDQPNVSHLYNAAGTYNVTLIVTNSFGCNSTKTIPVDVIEAPVANFQYTDDCSGLETTFRDASYANGPGNTVQYWWDFGDPSTSANNYSDLEVSTHIFSAPGTYQVMHVVRNFNNCTDTIIKPVIIRNPVPVDFVHEHICLNSAANFGPDTSVMNVADITSWTWDFGDGTINILPNTNHVYSVPGTYQVKLTVTHISGCTAYKIRTVTVNPLPVALFNVPQLPCVNAPVTFDDVSVTYTGFIAKWNWDFGDGQTKTISFPANPDTEHQYSAPGTYTIKVRITSSDSCTAEYSQTIVVNPAPTANFDYTNACQGLSTQFNDLTQTNGSGAIKGWSWDFGDGATGSNNVSALPNPEHTYSKTGTYQVTLTISSANGCSSSVVKNVVVTHTPFVDFSYNSHCISSAIQFTSNTDIEIASVASWNWSFGDGVTSVLPDPQHLYSTGGNYNVTLTITNTSGCQNTISHLIPILPAAVSKFSINAPACSQQQVAFINESSVPTGYIMRWEYNFGDGTGATIHYPANPNTVHTYTSYGTYNATLTVITNDSCSATSSKTITVLLSPMADFSFDKSCSDVPVQFNDLSQGNLISWAWNFDDPGSLSNNTSTHESPSHSFKHAGDFHVSLQVQNANGCKDTISHIISIAPKPVVDFSYNGGCAADTVHFNSSTYVDANNNTWFWQFGDNSTSADADPYHIYTTPGTYTVSLTITNQNGCTNVKTRQVQVTTAPIAMFTPSLLSCSGTAVLFTDHSSTPNGEISSWNWKFDDGSELTVSSIPSSGITHIYAHAGIYHVTLSIRTSTGCEASYTAAVTVNAAPVSAFSFTSSCAEIPTAFTDQSQASGGNNIIGWSWNFADPASGSSNASSLRNPQHLFSQTGTFSVSLTVENSKGCTSTSVQILTVTNAPAVGFVESWSCTNTPALFNADPLVTAIDQVAAYLWDFGDGTATSSEAEPGHVYAQAGNYRVTLTITNIAGCKNSTSHFVTVHASPTAQFTYSGNCASNQAEFTDHSYTVDGDKIVAWGWDFGVNNSIADISSKQNPSFMYPTAGSYNVSLTVKSTSGCTSVKVMPVTIMAAPKAKFSYTTEPCHNGSVIFKDESSGSQSMITSWKWEFAPGVYSDSQNPTYLYVGSENSFDVKLTVTTASGCTDTQVQKVTLPTGLEFAIHYTQACFGEGTWFSSSVLNPSGSSNLSYSWNFGDPASDFNNQSKLASPEHIFSKPGTYIVSLKATDINNCSTTRNISITVDPLPEANFSYSGGTCDSLISFKNMTSGINITRWIWQFGDGKNKIIDAPSNPNVNHYYTYPGIYKVTLIVQSEAGCIDTIVKSIQRTPCIAAAFKVSDPVVCQKRSTKFTETSTCQAPIASWQWFFGDNTSATYTSPQPFIEHTYAVPGNYTVKMVVASQMVGGLATDTASNQVAVKPAAKAAYKWQDVCAGNNTLFDNQTQNNNTTIKSYLWNFGDPGSSTDTTTAKQAQYKYDVSGTYDVKLVVTNTLGCTDTIVNKIHIFQSPAADFTWANSCEARPVYFTDQSQATTSALASWKWKFSNQGEILDGSTQRNCTYNFAHAGTYEADMMVTDLNGCSTTIKKQVTISPNPVAAFSIIQNYENKQGQIMISNGSIDGTKNEWSFSDGKTSFATNPVITFDKEGHYTIELTTWNDQNCSDTLSMSYDLIFKGLYVPNAFNPGNINPEVAVFKPKGTNLKLYNIGIYDQWGNLLWSSDKIDSKGSPAESWDGTVHGKLLQQDVYVWKISAQFNDGEVWDGNNIGNNDNMPQKKSGTITMIR